MEHFHDCFIGTQNLLSTRLLATFYALKTLTNFKLNDSKQIASLILWVVDIEAGTQHFYSQHKILGMTRDSSPIGMIEEFAITDGKIRVHLFYSWMFSPQQLFLYKCHKCYMIIFLRTGMVTIISLEYSRILNSKEYKSTKFLILIIIRRDNLWISRLGISRLSLS